MSDAVAQSVVPDTTLGSENTIVIPSNQNNGQVDLITGGALRGENLFHSFEQFSVPEGQAALFQSSEGISVIFSRVTGDNISEIYGTLGVLGPGDLIFLNSQGIFFGPDATLALEGSFIGTTASIVQFADGTAFSTHESLPLLTSSVPVGLGLSNSSGQISIENTGHTLVGAAFTPVLDPAPVPGIAVSPGQDIALIGGRVDLDGGVVRAVDGFIEIAAVEEGSVEISQLDNFDFSYDEAVLGEVHFDRRSYLAVSGLATGGDISVQGSRVVLLDSSLLEVDSFTEGGVSGTLQINAEELIIDGEITSLDLSNVISDGLTPNRVIPSSLITQNFGSVSGPDIIVNVGRIDIFGGGQIQTRNYGAGPPGNIDVELVD